jgi:hypothetical protein
MPATLTIDKNFATKFKLAMYKSHSEEFKISTEKTLAETFPRRRL